MAPSETILSLPEWRRETQRRILRVVLLVTALLLGGSLGYVWLEGWPWFDAFYMTVITVGTIGYGETHPLSTAGRWHTIGLILTSLVTIAYAASTLASFVFEGHYQRLLLGRRMDQQIARLSRHVLLCGAGRVGLHVAEELFKTRTPFVVIDLNPAAIDRIRQLGPVACLVADATQDETLIRAGIDRAHGLISTLEDDKDNVFVTLTGRSLNPQLRIVARLTQEENRPKLIKAGADDIVATEFIGGLRIASVMIRPTVVNFLDRMLRQTDVTLRFEELPADEVAGLVGQTLVSSNFAHHTGLLVLAIRTVDGGYRYNPGETYPITSGDVLIVFGTAEQLAAVRGQPPA